MDENNRTFNLEDTNLLDTEEVKRQAEAEGISPGDRELTLFDDESERLREETERINRKLKARSKLTGIICALGGILFGIALTLIIVSLITGGLGKLRTIRYMGEYDSSLFSELLYKIETLHFGETPSSEELTSAAAHSMVDAIGDRYAAYFTKEEYEGYYSGLNGKYKGGIGISIYAPDENGALIQRVYEGSFAEEAGLKGGDIVTAVDGVSVIGMSLDEMTDRIGGNAGTTVDITVTRGDETLVFTVMRGDVYVKRVDSMMLENDIGYIYVSSFTGEAKAEFEAALAKLQEECAKSLIIDLRYNPGGSLYTVVDMCDMLLPECTIVSMAGKTTDPTEYFKSDAKMCELPFVVLVNGDSASASEIFAGAMQDNGRAKILGTQTYGKGIVQTTFPLNDDHGWLKLTTDAYFTPNGTSLSGTGITPDMIVDLPEALQGYDVYTLYTEHLAEDTQMQAAIDYLLNGQN